MKVAAADARIELVTVYASGARVRRVTTIPAPLPSRVRIVGLPVAVIDDTVRIELGGPAVATAVRVGVDAPSTSEAAAEELAEVRDARRRVALAESEVERITSAIERVTAAGTIEAAPATEAVPAWATVIAARTSVVTLRAARELALREALLAARRALDEARRALEAIVDRDRRATSARPPRLHELRKYVEIDLAATAASEIAIYLEYLVGAARWAPSYVARIDGDHVRFEVRAVVAQDAGEDWSRVALRLSTAEPERFALLPELAPQKIGRRQAEPARPGFRAPPAGAEALYADYERAHGAQQREPAKVFSTQSRFEDSTYEGAPPAPPLPAPSAPPAQYARAQTDVLGGLAEEVWDDDSSRAKEAFSTPPTGLPMPQAVVAPPAPGGAAPKTARQAPSRRLATRREGTTPLPPPTLAPTPRLDYGNLRMAPPSSPSRGTLISAPADRHASAIATEVTNAQTRLSARALPAGCVTGWAHTYDYAFTTDGQVDVAADGGWHSIAVTVRGGSARLRHVAVPREQQDVFRVATIPNPLASPLLPGPIDVYDRGRFLVTSAVEFTPPGAAVEIGLGVDASVKVARNAEFREEAAGMLRGALRLHHAITIDVENLSKRAIELEVRERIPVAREGDDDVEILLGKVEPAWERWTPDPGAPRAARLRGGHRWQLAVPAGAKQTLRAAYEIKIAGKLELVGGNRREA